MHLQPIAANGFFFQMENEPLVDKVDELGRKASVVETRRITLDNLCQLIEDAVPLRIRKIAGRSFNLRNRQK